MLKKKISFMALFIASFMVVHIHAQENTGFRDVEAYDTSGAEFTDTIIEELITTLDDLLGQSEADADFRRNFRIHFWRFFNRLDRGLLTERQDDRIRAYIEGLKKTFPDAADLIEQQLFHFRYLMIGRKAPNIVGRDLQGEEFQLNDFRGQIVVLYFTGNWCGPCRGEYPYQRLLLEIMTDRPVVLLGVNSDADRDKALKVKQKERLDYRSWWAGWSADGDPRKGPIPREWNIVGWPTIYIIDREGVIRYRNLREEKVITAVKELLK